MTLPILIHFALVSAAAVSTPGQSPQVSQDDSQPLAYDAAIGPIERPSEAWGISDQVSRARWTRKANPPLLLAQGEYKLDGGVHRNRLVVEHVWAVAPGFHRIHR